MTFRLSRVAVAALTISIAAAVAGCKTLEPVVEPKEPVEESVNVFFGDQDLKETGNEPVIVENDGNLTIFVPVRNTEEEYLYCPDSQISVVDKKSNALIAGAIAQAYPCVLAQDETAVYVAVIPLGRYDTDVMTVQADIDPEPYRYEPVRLTASEHNASVDPETGLLSISGSIRNDTEEHLDNMTAAAFIWEQGGQLLGLVKQDINYIDAGETVEFHLSSDDISVKNGGNIGYQLVVFQKP